MPSQLHILPPFRAEHIGSLQRPEELLQGRVEFNQQQITLAELQQVEDKCIAGIVKIQREAGIKGITDGEFRRSVLVLIIN